MIQLSEAFSVIGTNNCIDVATSLAMQGTESEISIQLYDVFYMKLLSGEKTSFLANSVREYNAIRQLAQSCGAVACTINIMDIDILTIVGSLLIYTPNTGMKVFLKMGCINPQVVDEGILGEISSILGIEIPEGMVSMEFIQGSLDKLTQLLIDTLNNDLERYDIELLEWEKLPEFFNYLKESGEMRNMFAYRKKFGGAIL